MSGSRGAHLNTSELSAQCGECARLSRSWRSHVQSGLASSKQVAGSRRPLTRIEHSRRRDRIGNRRNGSYCIALILKTEEIEKLVFPYWPAKCRTELFQPYRLSCLGCRIEIVAGT